MQCTHLSSSNFVLIRLHISLGFYHFVSPLWQSPSRVFLVLRAHDLCPLNTSLPPLLYSSRGSFFFSFYFQVSTPPLSWPLSQKPLLCLLGLKPFLSPYPVQGTDSPRWFFFPFIVSLRKELTHKVGVPVHMRLCRKPCATIFEISRE